jgi:hypothetical protein
MRVARSIFLVGLLVALAGCGSRDPAVDYAPTGTIREIMRSVVDPSANALWQSVAVTATIDGSVSNAPQTDEGWTLLRDQAVALIEATNLLLVPNRHVAAAGETADNPDDERDPQEIETMMARDRATLLKHIGGFREAGLKMLAAVDSRDEMAILDAGDALNYACENCHMTYWYLE